MLLPLAPPFPRAFRSRLLPLEPREISEPPSKKAKYADLFSEFVQFMEHRESVSSRVSSQPSNPVPIYTTAVSNSQYPVRPVLPSVYGQIPQASSVAQVVPPPPPPLVWVKPSLYGLWCSSFAELPTLVRVKPSLYGLWCSSFAELLFSRTGRKPGPDIPPPPPPPLRGMSFGGGYAGVGTARPNTRPTYKLF